jgi:hypothetical protein
LFAAGGATHDTPKNKLRIGERGVRVAAPVARRPRVGTRALRPHLQKAGAIDGGNRAAAGADARDLDHGGAYHETEIDGRLSGDGGLAARNQADV